MYFVVTRHPFIYSLYESKIKKPQLLLQGAEGSNFVSKPVSLTHLIFKNSNLLYIYTRLLNTLLLFKISCTFWRKGGAIISSHHITSSISLCLSSTQVHQVISNISTVTPYQIVRKRGCLAIGMGTLLSSNFNFLLVIIWLLKPVSCQILLLDMISIANMLSWLSPSRILFF